MIPDNIVHQFGINTLAEITSAVQPDNEEQERQVQMTFYENFIAATDFIIKNFGEEMIQCENNGQINQLLHRTRQQYGTILNYRAEAREALAILEQEGN